MNLHDRLIRHADRMAAHHSCPNDTKRKQWCEREACFTREAFELLREAAKTLEEVPA